MTDLTFDEAIDKFRHCYIHGGFGSDEYQEALNTISFHWDYQRAYEINTAIAPSWHRPLEKDPPYVYILMSVRSNTYCILHRSQMAKWI